MLRTRIAPTPSGFLHEGNALNFLAAYLLVKENKGRLQLRIDDLDADRVRTEYLRNIFETLDWLGISWEEGAKGLQEHEEKYSQQLRAGRYNELIEALIRNGNVYACHCSRKEMQEQRAAGVWADPCLHKKIPLDSPDAALKVHIPERTMICFTDLLRGEMNIDLHSVMPGIIVRRRDGKPAYQIASLADDLDNGINFILRGADLLPSTAAQIHLSQLLDEKRFVSIAFAHHELILDDRGEKLSKSAGNERLQAAEKLVDKGMQHREDIYRKALGIFEKIQLSLPPFLTQ